DGGCRGGQGRHTGGGPGAGRLPVSSGVGRAIDAVAERTSPHRRRIARGRGEGAHAEGFDRQAGGRSPGGAAVRAVENDPAGGRPRPEGFQESPASTLRKTPASVAAYTVPAGRRATARARTWRAAPFGSGRREPFQERPPSRLCHTPSVAA